MRVFLVCLVLVFTSISMLSPDLAVCEAGMTSDVLDQPDGEPSSSREWTSVDGKYKVRGQLLRTTGRNIIIQRDDNGKEVNVPIAKLSNADQEFLQQQTTQDSTAKTGSPVIEEITNSIGMKLVLVSRGTFVMGSGIKHEVTISKDYYLTMHEVTQEQYEEVMGMNPSVYPHAIVQGDFRDHPVDMISWEDAVEFCERLSKLPDEKKLGRVYRLPTEAEWEFAYQTGTATMSYSDNKQSISGEHGGSIETMSHPVGQTAPNALGLYDMSGNVWEWCSDWYGEFPKESVTDPVGPRNGSKRVCRGGSWADTRANVEGTHRGGYEPSYRNGLHGFRLALSSPSGIPK
jgi:formylglycine-generating enzyme required for sulfatase activity